MNIVQPALDFILAPWYLFRHFMAMTASKLLLSNRGKRMLLAASLYAHLRTFDTKAGGNDEITAIAHDINQLFFLVNKSERALILPILIHDWIWKEIELPDHMELTNMPVRMSCSKIMKRIPFWLRYDDKVMSDDVSLVVRRCLGRNLAR